MAKKKGLIPFGGLGGQLRVPKGSGKSLGALRQQIGFVEKKPVNSLAVMQEAVEQRNIMLSIFYGLDYTASTSDVIPQFKKITNELSTTLNQEFKNPDQYFGTFSGSGINIGELNDKSPLGDSNLRGNSDVPRYINTIIDSKFNQEITNPIMFIFGDELDLSRANVYKGGDDVLNNAIYKLREKAVSLFFIYENTGNGNNTKDEISKTLIQPLGEKGSLIDMTNVDIDQLLSIIKGCISYTVQSNIFTPTNGGSKISLQDFLERKGVGRLTISQGEAPKQLRHL